MSELDEMISGVLSDPEQMAKITKLAQSLMGGDEAAASTAAPAADTTGLDALGLDGETLARIARLMRSGMGQTREEQTLLEAMRPYLSEKRRRKMDRAMKLARLARIARLAIGEAEEGGNA